MTITSHSDLVISLLSVQIAPAYCGTGDNVQDAMIVPAKSLAPHWSEYFD
jgi:hypothetical protein